MRGLNNENKRRKLFNWFNDISASIVMLQETFCVKEFNKFHDCGWKGKIIHNFSKSSHSKGTSILFKDTLDYEIRNIHKSEDSRILLIKNMFHL